MTLEQVSTLCPRSSFILPMICVQLADSTIQYLEGIVHNLLVQVKDTFIVADFVILDMEGDLGISLILGRPFLRDARAIIDVGTRKISLLIMGKNMRFRFQNKKQELLIHEDNRREGLYAEPAGKTKRSTSLQQN